MTEALYRVIPGRFLVSGYEPDGDSVRFVPDDPARLDGLPNRDRLRPGINDGSVQLRFEGIDTPELHFGGHAQPHGGSARDRLMQLMGFAVTLDGPSRVVSSQPDTLRGLIATRMLDPHGRVISHAFAGPTPIPPPDALEQGEVAAIMDSLNARLVEEGIAYPLAYTEAPVDHREWLHDRARAARAARRGVWAEDATSDFGFADHASITPPAGRLIFPKFFRRCIECLAAPEASVDLVGWLLRNEHEDDRIRLHGEEIRLHELFSQREGRLLVGADILDLVFVGK